MAPLSRLLGRASLAWVALLPSVAAAQPDEGIVTDRPDFVESSAVVGKGRLQVETSIALEKNRVADGRERTTSTPTLLRVGVSEALELRVESDGYLRYRGDFPDGAARARGWADTAVGLKWHALDSAGGGPSVGFLLHADLASGAAAFRGSGLRPSLRAVAEWDLPDDMSLGVMPGLIRDRAPDGSGVVNGIFGLVVGKEWNDRFRTFVEFSAPQVARARNGGTLATADLGGAWLVTPRCQVDAALSRGLNGRTPDWAFTVGMSFKL